MQFTNLIINEFSQVNIYFKYEVADELSIGNPRNKSPSTIHHPLFPPHNAR
jgi:hypothetical protein